MLQEDLRAQVEKVRRLVEQQQVRLVQQQGGQFDARLPTAGELGNWAFEIIPFELELPGDFAAFPIGLAAVAHEEIVRRFARQERIVLPQVSEPQLGMPHDFAGIELDIAEQHAQQRALAGPVAADETDFHVVDDRGLGPVEQNLVAIALMSVFDLQQHSHSDPRVGQAFQPDMILHRVDGSIGKDMEVSV